MTACCALTVGCIKSYQRVRIPRLRLNAPSLSSRNYSLQQCEQTPMETNVRLEYSELIPHFACCVNSHGTFLQKAFKFMVNPPFELFSLPNKNQSFHIGIKVAMSKDTKPSKTLDVLVNGKEQSTSWTRQEQTGETHHWTFTKGW